MHKNMQKTNEREIQNFSLSISREEAQALKQRKTIT